MDFRNIRFGSLAAITIFGVVGCKMNSAKLDTPEQKTGYAVGLQIGNNLKRNELKLDPDAVAAGVSDVLAGKEPKLKDEEVKQLMMALQEAQMKKMQDEAKKMQESAGDNLKKGEEFLAKNKENPKVKTTKSGLQYEVIQEGSGKSPKDNDTVSAHYTGTLVDGTKFDSSYDRNEPADFPVTGVIKGWTEALKMMKPGAKWKLWIHPELGYGEQGRPPAIPPNSVLVFDIELLSVKK